jgi:hypothetical protein
MLQSEADIRTRAATLGEEVAAGLHDGRALEWIEEVIGAALLDVARSERERCAALADRRAALWDASAERMSSVSTWPAEGLVEARERRKEALVIADAIREDAPTYQQG